MTATEELRRMLDERGVEWWQSANTLGCIFTRWYSPIFGDEVVAMENGEEGLVLFDHFVTPEQAIAATLGAEDAYTREDVESAFVSGYSLGCLPVGSDPTWDQNEQTVDEHMAEWGWVRKEAALGSGTCHDEGDPSDFCCSECGMRMFTEVNDTYTMIASDERTIIKHPSFCPNCGRRVV